MKLVLRANSNLATVKNAQEKTPLDLSTENKFHLCMELVGTALAHEALIILSIWLYSPTPPITAILHCSDSW